MKHLSLYQKYRPKNFSEIIGQTHVIKTLVNSIKLDSIGHAYIFSGPKGIGKTTIAKIFSKAINCLNFKDDICNECERCKNISTNDTTDILELDAASNNGVDDIRKILDNTKFLPISLKYKVYIIDEAHMLSNSSWNALLKTIEEPPFGVVFIFATTEFYKIPATIVSRCQCFEFNRLTDNQIKNLINHVNEKEKIKATVSAVNLLTRLSSGCARDALSMLEQAMLYTNNNITDTAINEMFGLTSNSEKIEFIKLLISQDINELMVKIEQYQQKGINFSQLILGLSNILKDQLIYLQTKNQNILDTLNISELHAIDLPKEKIISLINIFQKSYSEMRNNDDQQLVFQIMVFQALDKINSSEQKSVINENFVKSQTQKHIENSSKKTEIKSIDLQPIQIDPNATFQTQEIVISKSEKSQPNVKKVLVNKNVESKSVKNDIHEIILAILSNKSQEDTKNAKKVLNEFLSLAEFQPLFSHFSNNCKVSVASKNGILFTFKDPIDADWLNSNYHNKEIQTITKKVIGHVCHLIGSTYNELKDIHNKIGSIKPLPEPNLDSLNSLLDSNVDSDEIGKEIFDF